MQTPKKDNNFSKRKVELGAISEWVSEGESVLDLGCGRGVLLEKLVREKKIYGVGVDSDFEKISRAIKRGLNVIHGDICEALSSFEDKSFDWIVCSRTLPELEDPERVVKESLRVARRVAVGFINHGFWINRLNYLFKGERIVNKVYPDRWWQSRPTNPISVSAFKDFCETNDITINRRRFLGANWRTRIEFMPDLFSGYAIFELTQNK